MEVTAAEQAAGSVADELVISTITEFNLAVAMISRAVRALLPAYGGYECKEPEAGKFTLAFRCRFHLGPIRLAGSGTFGMGKLQPSAELGTPFGHGTVLGQSRQVLPETTYAGLRAQFSLEWPCHCQGCRHWRWLCADLCWPCSPTLCTHVGNRLRSLAAS